MYVYSFDLGNFETGKFIATRFPINCVVSGDWICQAESDRQALKLALTAALEEWAAPVSRHWSAISVEFVDCTELQQQHNKKGKQNNV